MRRHQNRLGPQRKFGDGRPFLHLQAQTVHARIKLQPEGMTRQRLQMAHQLLQRTDQRHNVGARQGRRISGHVTVIRIDPRLRSQSTAQFQPLIGCGHEERAAAFREQTGRDLRDAKAIGIRLDGCRRFAIVGRQGIQRAPVGGDGFEIDM